MTNRGPKTGHEVAVQALGPRYQQIARLLTSEIASGRYPIGAHLPTEYELCEVFRTSRSTAREAMRVLLSSRLVMRKPRIGTVVISMPENERYVHSASSVQDLLQYARDTELHFTHVRKESLTADRAIQCGAQAGDIWICASGVRRLATPSRSNPVCATRVFLNPVLGGIERLLNRRNTAVYALIERAYNVTVQRVEQEFRSVAIDARDAASLGVTKGIPGLLVLRRYFDGRNRMLELSESVHPGSVFTYSMQLHK